MFKNVAGKVKDFARDESGVSGIVVAIALIVIGILGGWYVYNQNMVPALSAGTSAAGAIQSGGSKAATDWSGLQ